MPRGQGSAPICIGAKPDPWSERREIHRKTSHPEPAKVSPRRHLDEDRANYAAPENGRFTILAVKKNGGGSPRRGKGVNANPTPIPV
jgi:hypothetical protein